MYTREKVCDMVKKQSVFRSTDISRLSSFYPSTCSIWHKMRPMATSGTYHVNPQGLLVTVFCDMTSKNGVGVTVIGHDSESRAHVSGYESPGSYKRNIKYDISMEQIVAIMKHSKNCEQFVKYECYHSTLIESGCGWWVSRQGSKMNYWGGAAIRRGSSLKP